MAGLRQRGGRSNFGRTGIDAIPATILQMLERIFPFSKVNGSGCFQNRHKQGIPGRVRFLANMPRLDWTQM